MDDQSSDSKKIQWKWIAITFVLYLIFYLLPLALAPTLLNDAISTVVVGVWLFAGIIIVAAVAAYVSKEVTIVEPAIAGALMVILLCLFAIITNPGARIPLKQATFSTVVISGIVFVLSLVGAWMGERAQKLWKSKSSQ